MAIPCAGVTVTWNSIDFQEVSEFRFFGPGSPVKGRTVAWTLDRGTIEVACFGTANVDITNYGKRYPLVVTGGGISFNVDCVYENVALEGVVNDVTRYRVTFKVMDTTGAGSVPT